MTLIVENGSGILNADSYVTIAFADDYLSKYGNPSAWTDPKASGSLTLAVQPVDNVIAQGSLTVDVLPVDGDTFTIDGKTYTLQAVLTDVDGNIQIAGSLALTQANIENAINLAGIPGTDYAASMTKHATVEAGSFLADVLTLSAITPGTSGNAIVLSETFTAPSNIFDGANLGALVPGVDGSTFDINGKTYIFQSALTNQDGHVLIGVDLDTTQNSVAAAINGDTTDAGVPAATTAHPDVEITGIDADTNVLTIQALVGGTDGNEIVTDDSGFQDEGNFFSDTTLAGGADDKETALRIATQYLDMRYALRWIGTRRREEQVLDWPRVNAVDTNEFYRDDEVPTVVQQATVEAALRHIQGTSLSPDLDNAGFITRAKVKIGSLEEDITYGGGGTRTGVAKFQTIDNLVKTVVNAPGIVRG